LPFAGRTVSVNGSMNRSKPSKSKNHQWLAKSIFRVGLDIINEALFKLAYGFENALKSLFPFLEFNQLCASG
jgi:hypothetical protein